MHALLLSSHVHTWRFNCQSITCDNRLGWGDNRVLMLLNLHPGKKHWYQWCPSASAIANCSFVCIFEIAAWCCCYSFEIMCCTFIGSICWTIIQTELWTLEIIQNTQELDQWTNHSGHICRFNEKIWLKRIIHESDITTFRNNAKESLGRCQNVQ